MLEKIRRPLNNATEPTVTPQSRSAGLFLRDRHGGHIDSAL
jgi:hypothetical protein